MGYWTDALIWCFTQDEDASVEAAISVAFERQATKVEPFNDVWAFTSKTHPNDIIDRFKAANFPDSFYPPVLMVRGEQDEFWRVMSHRWNVSGCCHELCADERKKAEEAEAKAMAYAHQAAEHSRRADKIYNERATDMSKALRENTAEWSAICSELNAKLKKAVAKNARLEKRLKK